MIEQSDLKQGRINDQLETQLESLSAQVEANLERSRSALSEWKIILRDRSSPYMRQADQLVRERPWEMSGAAVLLGLAVGFLLTRR